jgi:hypothetical protein
MFEKFNKPGEGQVPEGPMLFFVLLFLILIIGCIIVGIGQIIFNLLIKWLL